MLLERIVEVFLISSVVYNFNVLCVSFVVPALNSLIADLVHLFLCIDSEISGLKDLARSSGL